MRDNAAMRLADFLRDRGLTGSAARAALESGKVWVRGCPTALPVREVDPNDVEVRRDAPRMRVGRDPAVLARGEGWLAVWKPPGVLSVPAPGRREADLVGWVRGRFGEALPVHRLDEGTSGLLLVALREREQLALKALLERHEVDRRYLALVRGRFAKEATVRAPVEGKPAVTHFRAVERLRSATLVEARLETGRTHQVRIHLAELGHPVLGDELYGDGRGATRIALHAWRLAFDDPASSCPVTVEAILPDDLESLRRRLGSRGQSPTRTASR